MTARPIRRNAQTPDRNGKIFYTSTTSLSHISKNAGLITVARGTGGITLTRPLSDISFYDVYQAIEPVENGELFHFHEAPNPNCPVGKNIHGLLDGKLKSIQSAMENEMKKYTLSDLHTGMQELLKKEA